MDDFKNMDAPTKDYLTERQQLLLLTLVREYIAEPEPISSGFLAQKAALSVSSATVRNEMAVLEEKGFIRSPHTSAGRVPTEEGYRFFVNHLIQHQDVMAQPSRIIQKRLSSMSLEMDSWMQTAATMLAQETHSAALVTEPRILSENRLKHIQLIGIQGRMVLMVLVLTSGYVHQQMLLMTEPLSQLKLSSASEMLNRLAKDKNADGLSDLLRSISSTLVREIGQLVTDALKQMDELGGKIGFQAGFSELLPHLEERGAQQAIKVFEGETALGDIIDEVLDRPDHDIRVVVAGESRWEALSNLSMVLGRYSTGHMVGAIGVVGPTRMRYSTAIPAVRHVAAVVSQFLNNAHGYDKVNEKPGALKPPQTDDAD